MQMAEELQFLFKIARNAFILSGLYFFSMWATIVEVDYLLHIKPILVFFGTYVLVECAKRYKLDYRNIKPGTKPKPCTLIF